MTVWAGFPGLDGWPAGLASCGPTMLVVFQLGRSLSAIVFCLPENSASAKGTVGGSSVRATTEKVALSAAGTARDSYPKPIDEWL
jgi:hypothetical protein